MPKIVALDIGTKRIGVALSDDSGVLAFPHAVYERVAGRGEAAVIELVKSIKAEVLVAGLPLDEEGRRTRQCEDVENFCRRLARRLPHVQLVFLDEFGSSLEAERRLRETGRSARDLAASKGVLDASAATIVLQSYLDLKRNPGIQG